MGMMLYEMHIYMTSHATVWATTRSTGAWTNCYVSVDRDKKPDSTVWFNQQKQYFILWLDQCQLQIFNIRHQVFLVLFSLAVQCVDPHFTPRKKNIITVVNCQTAPPKESSNLSLFFNDAGDSRLDNTAVFMKYGWKYTKHGGISFARSRFQSEEKYFNNHSVCELSCSPTNAWWRLCLIVFIPEFSGCTHPPAAP